ncbi:class I SAM-dependent methyltransferase [Paenalkalicoccus suaedae]|uniref:Class I SAM-dependent methyltransferase n=1 Tax=Paenalkalicoccus suaedae TaxID=2592382 RepID=A0A859FE32_9BACI|nr:class I SAM-dependent methyltransferase [Paenalkalicoccus suaedae]QKS71357.1 class I SAM-dependent methyltransferase [Paenalkalicoccus suaedae]
MEVAVTTASKRREILQPKAMELAKEWGYTYVPRERHSIDKMLEDSDILVVVKATRVDLFKKGQKEAFYFHPSGSHLRALEIRRSGRDPLIKAANISPDDKIVDCTLGLGSDAIILSVATPKGQVIGLESVPYTANIVKHGLQTYESELDELTQAMRRITVQTYDYTEWLIEQPTNSQDIIYFDPMFHEQVASSNGINALRAFANGEALSEAAVLHAKRVARKRVVLKDSYHSPVFDHFGFEKIDRQASHIYGVIDCSEGSL